MDPFSIDLGAGNARSVTVHPACAMSMAEQFLRKPDSDSIALGILIGRRSGATISVTDAFPLAIGPDQQSSLSGGDGSASGGVAVRTTTEQQAAIAKAASAAVPGEEPVGWYLVRGSPSDTAASAVVPPDSWAILMHEACTKFHGARQPVALYTRVRETAHAGGGIDPRMDMCAYVVQRSLFLRDIAQPFRRLPVHVVAEESERAAAWLSLRHMAFQGSTDELTALAHAVTGGPEAADRHAGLMSPEPEVPRPAGLPVPRHRNAVQVVKGAAEQIRRARATDPEAAAAAAAAGAGTPEAAALAGAREGPAAAVRLETRAHLRRLADLVEGAAAVAGKLGTAAGDVEAEAGEPLARLAAEAALAFPRLEPGARARAWEAASADAAAAAQVGGLARSLAAACSGSQAGSIGV